MILFRTTAFSILVMCSIALPIHAQDEKGYVGISLGPSVPMGNFSNTDPDNQRAGWAGLGAILDMSFTRKIAGSKFGMTSILRRRLNPLNEKALVDELATLYPSVNWSVESSAWKIGGFMLGGFGIFRLSSKSSIETKALVGFFRATSPEYKVTRTFNSGWQAWVKQSSASASPFAYLIGASLRVDKGEKLYYLIGLDYIYSKPKFGYVVTRTSDGYSGIDSWSQGMGTLSLSAGIALKL